MLTTRANDGGFTVETELHGATFDELEGRGLLTLRPGVVDVPSPNAHELSVVEADLWVLVRHLLTLGVGLVDPETGDYWDGTVEPAMGDAAWLLRGELGNGEGPSYLLRWETETDGLRS